MNLDSIKFPLYYLGNRKPEVKEGVIFYFYGVEHYDGEESYQIQIVDDKNIGGNSLAVRRLKLQEQKTPLFKLTKAIFFLGDLVKLTSGVTWYIDSEGQLFEYKKTRRVPLVFKPISCVLPNKTGGAIVEVAQVNSRFKTLLAPTGLEKWAGLLQVGHSYILYGLYENKLEDTYRMI